MTDLSSGDTQNPEARLIWQSVDNPLFKLDEETLTVKRIFASLYGTS